MDDVEKGLATHCSTSSTSQTRLSDSISDNSESTDGPVAIHLRVMESTIDGSNSDGPTCLDNNQTVSPEGQFSPTESRPSTGRAVPRVRIVLEVMTNFDSQNAFAESPSPDAVDSPSSMAKSTDDSISSWPDASLPDEVDRPVEPVADCLAWFVWPWWVLSYLFDPSSD
eukprot:scaffold651021_cov34-Prasinocladus_malaysianus.AAC.1